MSRYAPARDDGRKPYVVERREWGRMTEHLVHAENARDAAYCVKGRQLHVTARARRATPDDVKRLARSAAGEDT